MKVAGFSMALLACMLSARASAQPPPVEAYGRLPAIHDVRMSPDGKRVAVAVSAHDRGGDVSLDVDVFRVINLESGTIEHTVAPPDGAKLRSVGWADDGRPYYTASAAMDVMKMIVSWDGPRPAGPLASICSRRSPIAPRPTSSALTDGRSPPRISTSQPCIHRWEH